MAKSDTLYHVKLKLELDDMYGHLIGIYAEDFVSSSSWHINQPNYYM